MRAVLAAFAVAGLLAPLPSLAAAPGPDSSDIAEELTDPARQAQIAAMVETMADVLLAMPAAPFLRAAATMAGENPEAIDEDATVGDLAGPGAAEAPREFAQRLPQMMSAMAIMAAAFAEMAPLMRERLEAAAPPADYR